MHMQIYDEDAVDALSQLDPVSSKILKKLEVSISADTNVWLFNTWHITCYITCINELQSICIYLHIVVYILHAWYCWQSSFNNLKCIMLHLCHCLTCVNALGISNEVKRRYEWAGWQKRFKIQWEVEVEDEVVKKEMNPNLDSF